MNAMEETIFSHHDRIRNVKIGSHLMADRAVTALINHEGGQLEVPAGATLRVKFNDGVSAISCELALNGQVRDVAIFPSEFHCVEVSD